MQSNLIFINKSNYEFNLNDEDKVICLFDFNYSEDLNLNFNINNNSKIAVYYLNFNKAIKNKTIHFRTNIIGSHNHLTFINNCFLNHSNLFFKFKANDQTNLINNYIDLKINTVIEDENSSFKTCPVYDFFTNSIDAKHALNIGIINHNYIDYLMSRGINLNDAKILIYQSKINQFINVLNNEQDKELIQQEIQKF